MKIGDVVKFREILEPGDDLCRFVVRELRGDRVLVEEFAVCQHMSIKPHDVFPIADLIPAE